MERGRDRGYSGATAGSKQCKRFSIVDSEGIVEGESWMDPLAIRNMKAAMIERAWNDLACSHEVTQKDRRSAIHWFRGSKDQDAYLFSFKSCCENCGPFNESRTEKLNARLKDAEDFNRTEAKPETKCRDRKRDRELAVEKVNTLGMLYRLGLRIRPEDETYREEARDMMSEIEDVEFIAV